MPAKMAKISNVKSNENICMYIFKATTATYVCLQLVKFLIVHSPCVIASVAAGVGCAEAAVLMMFVASGWIASEVVAVPPLPLPLPLPLAPPAPIPGPDAPFSSVPFVFTSRSTSRCRNTRIFSSF